MTFELVVRHRETSTRWMRDGDVTTCASTNSLATRSLWDWQSGHLVCPPGRHSFKICAAAFTPDGRWGLVGGGDPALGTRTAQAWEFITGKRKRHAQLEKAVEAFKGEIKRNGHWLMPPDGRRT
jgi:hypothetical protein